jgi:hypothetical protein
MLQEPREPKWKGMCQSHCPKSFNSRIQNKIYLQRNPLWRTRVMINLMLQLSTRNGRTRKLVEGMGMGSLILLGARGIQKNQLWWYQILLSD